MRRLGGEGHRHRPLTASSCGSSERAEQRDQSSFAANSCSETGEARCSGPNPSRPLYAKLSRFVELTPGETAALDLLVRRYRVFHAEEILIHDGEKPEHACLILQGFAYRYKLLPEGHRQILGYLIAGDLCDVEFADGNRPDHSVAASTDVLGALIPLKHIVEIRAAYPRIDNAFFMATMAERSILRQWLLNVGHRNSLQRVSHFLCEISVRLRAIGQVNADGRIDWPVSQSALADTTGLTTVHVNRTLQRLRNDGLIALHRNRLTILDSERLAQLAGFDEDYLLRERYSE